MVGVSLRRCPFGQRALFVAVVFAVFAVGGRAAPGGDYEAGPVWVYARGDGCRTFGEAEYGLQRGSGRPAATLDFKNIKAGEVTPYRLPNDYAALRIGGNADVVVIRLYSECGENFAVGVFRVKFADGQKWITRQRQNDVPYKGNAFDHLDQVRRLPSLSLSGMKLTESDLVRLKEFPHLHTLNLSKTNLTDADLKHLIGLTRLRRLSVSCTNVSEAAVRELRQSMPQVRVIH